MPMTIKQLIAKSTRDRIVLSREVALRNVKQVRQKGTNCTIIKAMTYSPYHPKTGSPVRKPERYETRVKGLEPDKPLSRQYVEVDCTCGDFWCTWEVALNRKGAAQIRRSNGEPPVVKNPQEIPGVCKHLLALFNHILRSGL